MENTTRRKKESVGNFSARCKNRDRDGGGNLQRCRTMLSSLVNTSAAVPEKKKRKGFPVAISLSRPERHGMKKKQDHQVNPQLPHRSKHVGKLRGTRCSKQARKNGGSAGKVSRDKMCSICLEVVMEKVLEDRVFGLLPNCSHCFCLSCIRKWREHDHRWNISCPVCRAGSAYIIPSLQWVEDTDEKLRLVSKTRRFGHWYETLPILEDSARENSISNDEDIYEFNYQEMDTEERPRDVVGSRVRIAIAEELEDTGEDHGQSDEYSSRSHSPVSFVRETLEEALQNLHQVVENYSSIEDDLDTLTGEAYADDTTGEENTQSSRTQDVRRELQETIVDLRDLVSFHQYIHNIMSLRMRILRRPDPLVEMRRSVILETYNVISNALSSLGCETEYPSQASAFNSNEHDVEGATVSESNSATTLENLEETSLQDDEKDERLHDDNFDPIKASGSLGQFCIIVDLTRISFILPFVFILVTYLFLMAARSLTS